MFEEGKSKILNDVAPCSMFCSTCTGCKNGEISKNAKELLHYLEGHEEFLDSNLKKEYRHKLDEFKAFRKKLKKYAYPKCSGCRNGGASGCSIKDCFIFECTKEHNVDFCGECAQFPCDKVNEKIYKKNVVEKWIKGNQEIKNLGIELYYEANRTRPHYEDYLRKR